MDPSLIRYQISNHYLLGVKHGNQSTMAGSDGMVRLKYVDHVDGSGTALFRQVCKLDLEGIVAKQKFGPDITDRESSTWFKIRNREYSQMVGREELFERERYHEPVPGWHSCVVACAELME